jgi:D-alanyl-D-alanine carboxypeptidase/D-alanyl-D-alanine-endopeptidase (penicillin-binding protein 4)
MKRLILLAAIVVGVAYPQISESEMRNQIDELYDQPLFRSAIAAIEVVDLEDGKTVYRKNDRLLTTPASNVKLYTTAAALLFLGEDYEFATELRYMGEIYDSVLYGDVYVVGGMDPDLTFEDIQTLAREIADLGVKEIRGDLLADVSAMDSLFWGEGWMWDDDPSTDSPYLTPLTVNDNATLVRVFPIKEDSALGVEIVPAASCIEVENRSFARMTPMEELEVTRDYINRRNAVIIKGDLSLYEDEDWESLNVYEPAMYFMTLLRDCLDTLGVSVAGDIAYAKTPPIARPVHTIRRPFGDVIVNLNKESDNLSAELTLRAMGAFREGTPGTAEKGLRYVDSLIELSGRDPDDYRFADGSGLSRYNLITADLTTQVLRLMFNGDRKTFETFKESLPVAGEDGTLERRMRDTPAEGKVFAKTGTMSGVSALSGYVETVGGRDLAFSIMVQRYVGSSRYAKRFEDGVCEILAQLE